MLAVLPVVRLYVDHAHIPSDDTMVYQKMNADVCMCVCVCVYANECVRTQCGRCCRARCVNADVVVALPAQHRRQGSRGFRLLAAIRAFRIVICILNKTIILFVGDVWECGQ